MSKFFDISKKVLYFAYIALVSIFFFFPTVPAVPSRKPLIIALFQGFPEFKENLSNTSFSSTFHTNGIVRWTFLIIFFVTTLISLSISLVMFFRKKYYCLFPFLLSASLFFLCYCVVYANYPNSNGVMSLSYHYISHPNATAVFILFFLYIVYHLLRRYYAPVKARIQASRAEHQANQPTKDERIAELERKVAELESKNKDEQ